MGTAYAAQADDRLCEAASFGGASYAVCTVKRDADAVHLFWRGADGQPYRTFSALADAVQARGQTLAFAMNGGMFDDDFSPVGLYVEDGRELRPVNTASRLGSPASVPNFYKKPNGVFFIDEKDAGILSTEEYLKRRPNVKIATQSGPMLVINGVLHPAFIQGSTDRRRRDGVGICGDDIKFVISEDDVNFHDFARVFRDDLKCSNALFLDGGRGTGLYSPELDRNDRSGHGGYGPMIAIVR
ncbi:phosphodiester glycosidase family protein [Rhizobium sp. S152]|nr:phosphodiester glycosidase family protein [Rhizobium sp. S152]MDM9625315.1 phosphodiester glycosidase family protein [Rhizobium sp. S152]